MQKMFRRHAWSAAAALAGLLAAACAESPTGPASLTLTPPNPTQAEPGVTSAGAVSAQNQNRPPNAVFRTDPRESSDGVLGGTPPLQVTFNMCQSTDPDPGDRLRYTLDFDGDGAVNLRGTCRLTHTYTHPMKAVACVDDRTSFEGHRICKEYQIYARPTTSPPSSPPAPDNKFVFVSTQTTNGNIGGVAGADAICQADAAAAGLSGNFLAWISDSSGNSPSTRFTRSPGPYVLPDGVTQIASSYADLIAGDLIANPINQDAFGVTLFAQVWTGTTTAGRATTNPKGRPAGGTCNDWSTSSIPGGSPQGIIGTTSAVNSVWSGAAAAQIPDFATFCTLGYMRLYCFQQ